MDREMHRGELEENLAAWLNTEKATSIIILFLTISIDFCFQ